MKVTHAVILNFVDDTGRFKAAFGYAIKRQTEVISAQWEFNLRAGSRVLVFLTLTLHKPYLSLHSGKKQESRYAGSILDS
ncbi:MAG: hypothetical protein P8X90_12955 [Desulfobacterales bacterium]